MPKSAGQDTREAALQLEGHAHAAWGGREESRRCRGPQEAGAGRGEQHLAEKSSSVSSF